MANANRKTYDVFVSYSHGDAALASDVADACRASGLVCFTGDELPPGIDWQDALWEALAESQALVVILAPSGPTPEMLVTIGAAQSWTKPIYAIVTDPSATHLLPALSKVPTFTSGRLPDVIRSIASDSRQFSDDDRSVLAGLYAEIGLSLERLMIDPRRLNSLAREFAKGTGKTVSGERLVSELLKLRKKGKLAKSRARRPNRKPT